MRIDFSEEDEPRIYKVRVSEPAEAEIDAAYLQLMGATSFQFADRWQDNLFQAIQGLSQLPMRYEAVEPGSLSNRARRMIFRQGRVVYRVHFDVIDEDDDGRAETVVVQHIRAGAQQEPSEEPI